MRNSYHWYNPRWTRESRQGIHQVDSVISLTSHVKALKIRINQLTKAQVNAIAADLPNSSELAPNHANQSANY